MIKSLSNKKHEVITGISLINLSLNKKVTDYVVSEVTFKDLSEETIKDYIKTKESLDKAGAYGIQGSAFLLVFCLISALNPVLIRDQIPYRMRSMRILLHFS